MLTSVGVPIGFALGGLAASKLVTISGWPAIFVAGGTGPLVMAPLLALWLPEPIASRARRRDSSAVAALFWDGLAPITLLLWAVNFLSLLGVYFILLWSPALLHHAGASPSRAIFATTMYASSVIAGGFLMASIVDRVGMERVLACGLAFGACCVFPDRRARSTLLAAHPHAMRGWIWRRLSRRHQRAIGPCLSAGNARDWSGLGAGRGTRRGDPRTGSGRRIAGARLSGTGYFCGGVCAGLGLSAVNGCPRGIETRC